MVKLLMIVNALVCPPLLSGNNSNLFSVGFPAGVEWVDTPHRAFMGVIGSLSWAFGNMLLAVFAYLVNDWRMLILTVTSPLGLAILTWWYEKHLS